MEKPLVTLLRNNGGIGIRGKVGLIVEVKIWNWFVRLSTSNLFQIWPLKTHHIWIGNFVLLFSICHTHFLYLVYIFLILLLIAMFLEDFIEFFDVIRCDPGW